MIRTRSCVVPIFLDSQFCTHSPVAPETAVPAALQALESPHLWSLDGSVPTAPYPYLCTQGSATMVLNPQLCSPHDSVAARVLMKMYPKAP